ncbi:MAG: hypothetical protein AB7H70_08635 [Rhodospirillaceae bacterium]|nr:hypothetical protein [Rhodospirillaceae bacterium]
MGKFALLQAVYAVTGIMFFVRDLMVERTPMDKAMINAFIWPYAQFQVMKVTIMTWIDSALAMIQ